MQKSAKIVQKCGKKTSLFLIIAKEPKPLINCQLVLRVCQKVGKLCKSVQKWSGNVQKTYFFSSYPKSQSLIVLVN